MSVVDVHSKQKKLQSLLAERGLDAIFLTSFDRYLNEYVPLEDCHRHDVTAFKGSVADVILPVSGKVLLFVDGRYHEQADKQCDLSLVEVVKCPYGVSNFDALKETIVNNNYKKIAIEGERIGVGPWRELCELCQVEVLTAQDLQDIGFGKAPVMGEMKLISDDLAGESVQDKLSRLCQEGEAIFVTALDSVSWLSNTRGYQLPFQSTSRAQAFATKNQLFLLPDEGAKIASEVSAKFELINAIKELPTQNLKKISFYPAVTTVLDYLELKKFGVELVEKSGSLTHFHADKNPVEIKVMEDSFDRGDQAIYKTLLWLKSEVHKRPVSEQEFNDQTSIHYKEVGALGQSFRTISGFGANSSIMHYGTPSKEKMWEEGELALLDSGAFFDGGLATDTTRTILPKGSASPNTKQIYTLVLKGLLQAQNAVFPVGTRGQAIDALARAPMRRMGYDFAHGTGHGVGINVHEGGYSVTPISQVPLVEGRVGSIEPGIYIPGFGGVRLENIALVEKHPTYKGMLRFKPLVWIGYDLDLIEKTMLNQEEIQWFMEYEAECQKRGRSFRP
ncbi:MAG: M24 family metallopeptidase [bacterium]